MGKTLGQEHGLGCRQKDLRKRARRTPHTTSEAHTHVGVSDMVCGMRSHAPLTLDHVHVT